MVPSSIFKESSVAFSSLSLLLSLHCLFQLDPLASVLQGPLGFHFAPCPCIIQNNLSISRAWIYLLMYTLSLCKVAYLQVLGIRMWIFWETLSSIPQGLCEFFSFGQIYIIDKLFGNWKKKKKKKMYLFSSRLVN